MRKRLLSIFVAAVVVVLGVPGIALAAPQDFTVNVTADHDDGSCDVDDCTLREAIIASNFSPPAGTISFDIRDAPLGSVQTITLLSSLPFVTQPVTIDGYTEPGASPNTLKLADGDDAVPLIELDGSGGAFGGFGLSGQGAVVRGLVLNRFPYVVFQVVGDDNVIEGNFIGVDPTGSLDEGNGADAIVVLAGSNNRIGGASPSLRNVISGNTGGIEAFGTGTLVQGNYIGVNAAGDAAIGNDGSGVIMIGSTGLLGGPGAGNLISGNGGVGIDLEGSVAQGNLVGTNARSTAAIPNSLGGVLLYGGSVGGSALGEGNVIAGNEGYGVWVNDAPSAPLVEGNWIGVTQSGSALPNGGDGVSVFRPHSAVIRSNVVAFNDGSGIGVSDPGKASVANNEVHDNGGLGIDLAPTGVTPNDPGDGDTGPNGLQNFPVLTVVAQSLGGTNVQGTLNSIASTTFDVEIFSSPSCDSSGNGEGQTPLGSLHVTTNPAGNASFEQQFAAALPLGSVVTATATSPEGTSEFSACQTVAKPKTDLSLVKEDLPNIVEAGQNVTYTLTVSNNGPNAATGVGLSDPLPATADLVSVSTSQGACTSGSTVVCTLGTIVKDGSATVTIVARLSTAGSVTNTATVDGTETDINQGNNTASAITIVTPNAEGCTVVGSAGNDSLTGTAGDDTICGLGGNDTLLGKKGNDVLLGGDGNDTLKGGVGGDQLYGEAGNDTAVGGQGFDAVFGGIGADTLKIKDGVHGNDSADGGIDADVDVCKKDSGDTVTNCP